MMTRIAGLTLLVATIVLAGPPAHGDSADASAGGVINAYRETLAKLTNLHFDARHETSVNGKVARVVTGRVIMLPLGETSQVGSLVSVKGEQKPSQGVIKPFHFAFDGTTAYRLQPELKMLQTADEAADIPDILRGLGDLLLPRDMYAKVPFETAAPMAQSESPVQVGNALCDVVVFGQGQDRTEKWYFGKDDHLPVRVEEEYVSGTGRRISTVLTFSNIEKNRETHPESFEIALPKGFNKQHVSTSEFVRKPINPGDLAPEWTLTSFDGEEVSLTDFRGDVLIMEFWSSWCPYCRKSMPAMKELHNRYGGHSVSFVGINCRDRSDEQAEEFVREVNMPFPMLRGGTPISSRYRTSLPSIFVIDTDGTLIQRFDGFGAKVEQQLDDLLRQKIRSMQLHRGD